MLGECQKCGSREHISQHHVYVQRVFNGSKTERIFLCFSCHNKIERILLEKEVELLEGAGFKDPTVNGNYNPKEREFLRNHEDFFRSVLDRFCGKIVYIIP